MERVVTVLFTYASLSFAICLYRKPMIKYFIFKLGKGLDYLAFI